MEIIALYGLFALTTAFTAHYELIGPVLFELEMTHPDDMMIENRSLSNMVFLVASFLFAPLVIIPCIVPSIGERVRNTMVMTLRG